MGWTYSHKQRGQSVQEFFENSGCFKGVNGHEFKLLKMKVVKMRTAYCAVWHKAPDGKEHVFGTVILLNYAPSDYHNFGYKEVEESCGPYEAQCPADILDMLSPTDAPYALQWRAKCRENLKKKEIKNGTLIRLEHELKFTNGDILQEFIYRKIGRKIRFENPTTGQLYFITGFEKMSFEIVEQTAGSPA